MRELSIREKQEVNGGVVALGWVVYGTFHAVRFGVAMVRANPRTSAAVGGVIAG